MIKYLSSSLASFLISLALTWSIGLIIISKSHYLEDVWTTWLYGIINVLLAVGFFSLIISPLYLLGRRYKTTRIITHLIFCAILTLELISIFYFSITLTLLDNTVFLFSFDQANIIVNNYFVFQWIYLLLPLPSVIYFIGIKFFTLRNDNLILYSFLAIGIIAIFLGLKVEKDNGSFTNIPENKTIHFIQSIYKSQQPKLKILANEHIDFYQKTTNPQLQNSTYPLYRENDKENPLGPFFDLKESPPNIVFLIVEGLSSSFSGPDADEISYTPFLDSLAQHALYFDNSLATSERSFAVLPSILGSLPHGKKGFTNNSSGYPNNETLATWLIDNGYTGNFHFGGYARFDYMDLFINDQGFSNIYDRKEYNYEGTGLKTSIDSIPFGIPDKQFLKNVLEINNTRKNNSPFIDVYLTLSMHYPYIIEEHERYHQMVETTIKNSSANEQIKKKHMKYIAEFATFHYTDDALKEYFKSQQSRPEHQNTIYVILGDHMMGEIAQSSAIEKYRSALMIYSPLLKRTKTFKGTNSHLDIPPSFHNLLSEKYNYPKLDSVSWLGKPFDTSATFQSNRDVLFMLNNRKVRDILHKEHYLSEGRLYKVGDRLQLTAWEDEEKKELLSQLLEVSTLVHDKVVSQNILIPYKKALKKINNVSKQIHMNNKAEFYNITEFELKEAYEEVLFELNISFSGDWKMEDPHEENPILVYSAMRGDSTLTWNKLDLNLQESPLSEERVINFLIKNTIDFELQKGDRITVYFWNKAQLKQNYEVIIPSLTVKAPRPN